MLCFYKYCFQVDKHETCDLKRMFKDPIKREYEIKYKKSSQYS